MRCSHCSCRYIQRGEDPRERQRAVRLYSPELTVNSKPRPVLQIRGAIQALKSLKADSTVRPHIPDIRGQGLMIAVEFAPPLQPTLDRTVKGTPRSLPMEIKLVQRCIEEGPSFTSDVRVRDGGISYRR